MGTRRALAILAAAALIATLARLARFSKTQVHRINQG